MKTPLQSELLKGRRVIGWQEHVALPDLQIDLLKAKIDTGARTSALHAIDLKVEQRGTEEWISFHVPRKGVSRTVRHEALVVDHRPIKNTSGIPQFRYVIKTKLVLGSRQWAIEVSLADRKKMKFDMILGRTAIRRHKLLVAAGKSYLAGNPTISSTQAP